MAGKPPNHTKRRTNLHDARNMLVALQAPLKRLHSEFALPHDARDVLESALVAAETLSTYIVSELQAEARAAVAFDARWGDPIAVVGELHKVFSRGEKGSALSWNILVSDDVDGVSVETDVFQRAMQNLISNAVKFTEVGGITIHLRKAVRAPANAPNAPVSMLVATVIDSGLGIPESTLETLFSATTARATDRLNASTGLGIGLGPVREALLNAGGGISAANRTDTHGAQFDVWLPTRSRTQPPGELLGPAKSSLLVVSGTEDAGAFVHSLASDNMLVASSRSPSVVPRELTTTDTVLDIVLVDALQVEEPLWLAARSILKRRPRAILVALTALVGDAANAEAYLARSGFSAVLAPGRLTTGLKPTLERLRRTYSPPQPGVARFSPAQWTSLPLTRALKGRSVLLVEDNVDNLNACREALLRAGARVFEATSAAAALPMLDTNQVDALLCDFHLGDATAADVIHAWRSLEKEDGKGQAPVFVMSGENPDTIRAALPDSLKVRDIFTKPFDDRSLVETIAASLSHLPPPESSGPFPRVVQAALPQDAGHAEGPTPQSSPSDSAGTAPQELEALTRFRTNCRRVTALVAAGDPDALFRHVHNLKSSAAALDADDVLALLQQCTRQSPFPEDAETWAAMVDDESRLFLERARAVK